MKKLISSLILAAMATMPILAIAGPDGNQQMMTEQLMQAKKKLAAAEAAQGTEQQKMMSEHMAMMTKTMGEMQKMKPGANMTPQQQTEWITEHQRLMDMMMGQMMGEHHLMMQAKCK